MRPHSGLNARTPHNVHFLKDLRQINVIVKEILDIKLKKNIRKSKSRQKNKKTIYRSAKLKVGSYVRLVLASVTQAKFTKGYNQQNTQEVFKIHTIKKNTQPITYKLKDLSNELIKGSFYGEELVETVKPDFFLINKIICSKTINNKNFFLFLGKVMMSRLIRGSKVKQSTTSKKINKKIPLSVQFCDFILMLKSKDETQIKKIVKSFPNHIINAISEVISNGICGNIPLNKSDIEKLKPFRRLMKSLSNKTVKVGERKKLMISKKGGSLLSIIIPLAATAITSLISRFSKK